MELKDYVRILRRRWYVVLVIAATVGAIHASLVRQESLVYESQAEIVVKEPQYFYISGGGDYALPWMTISPETRFTLLKSEPVLRKTVGHLWSHHGLFKEGFEFDEKEAHAQGWTLGEIKIDGKPVSYRRNEIAGAIEVLRTALSVSKQKETQIVVIAARHADPVKSRWLADSLAQAFREYMDQDSEEQVAKAMAFLDKQIAERSKDINAMERDLSHRKVDLERLGGTDKGDLQLLQDMQRLAELNREIAELTYEIEDLKEKIQHPPASVVELIPVGSEVQALRSQAEGLQGDITRDELNHTPDYPPLLRKKAQLDDLLRRIGKAAGGDNARRTNLAVQGFLAAMQEKATRKKAREDERKGLSESVSKRQRENEPQNVTDAREGLSLLEGKLQIAQSERQGFISRQSNIALSQQAKEPLIDILAEANDGRPLAKAAQSSWPFVLLIGGIVGIGSAYFLEYMSSTIRTESDVKRYVNLQLLGAVLRIKEPDQRLLLNVAQKQPLHEVYNMIGALMESYAVEHKAKVFMVASSRAEEGKSTVTTNLGIALAKSGERVILIDCDLRKAVLHKFLNVDNSRGISTALLSEREGGPPVPIEELLKPTEVEGLRLLPAGAHPQNPVGLLKSEAFRRILREARDQADVVLVDVPPVNMAVDPIVLAPLMDGIILLVSAGDVAKEEVTHAKRLLESSRGKLIGCILNKVTLEGRGYYYYYYHYYYDAYKAYRES